MQEAEDAFNEKTYPVGAVIVSPEGEIIGRGHNHVYHRGDFTSHAEVEAIRNAGEKLMKAANFKRCTLYTTLEPCLMCCGAILRARIANVVWLKDDNIGGALRHLQKNIHLFYPYYTEKLGPPKIFLADEPDLIERIENWMEKWDNMKEGVLREWKQGCVREELVKHSI